LNWSDKVQLKEDETITYYCATKPNYENTTFTTWTSTQVNQAWQNIDKNSPCYYTCEDWWSGNNCNINANLKYPYLELVNWDTLNQQTTNTLTFNFYITDPTVITTSWNWAIIYYELSYDWITYTWSWNSSIYVNSWTLNNTPFTFSLDLENITPWNINYKFWAENSLGNTGNIISGSFIKK
jgi:hypothetical protein